MSFARSERKVATGITPKKVKGESRNDSEIENTVKNTLHSAWTPTKGGTLNNQVRSSHYLSFFIIPISLLKFEPFLKIGV